MYRILLSLLLLLAIGLGLSVGPHPCQDRQVEPESAAGSCHMQQAEGPFTGPSVSTPGGHDCCDASHGSLCEHACQMTAVAQGERLAFRIALVAQTVAAAPDPELSPIAYAIDHIPIA